MNHPGECNQLDSGSGAMFEPKQGASQWQGANLGRLIALSDAQLQGLSFGEYRQARKVCFVLTRERDERKASTDFQLAIGRFFSLHAYLPTLCRAPG